MKRPTTFLHRLLINEAMQVSVAVNRDCQEIDSRFEHEGMSFLTITLPSLDDALVQGLVKGRITPSMFPGFRPVRRGGNLPAFMAGFFMRVFREDGSLRDEPCINAIRAIRQITRAFKKVELPCSPARISAAFERYRSNDESIQGNYPDNAAYRSVAGILWSGLEKLSEELYCSPGVFGTGATAERLKLNQRHAISEWPERAEACFPMSYHTSHSEDDIETFAGIRVIPECEELPVRVVGVPKTLKTPRIISVEPSYMMLMQQSVAKPIMAWLESGRFEFQSIRFSDQRPNRENARLGSIDGSLATIDLKDASDLVSNDLVKGTFGGVAPTFLDLIQSCRSQKAKLPDSSVITLRKFASQGSALCFPIEAMVFFTVVMYSISRQSGGRPSLRSLKEIAAKVSIYGDDIVVPGWTASGVMEDLEAFGLKVNHDKSFTTGYFRESCGGDFYKGEDITPTYVRLWDFTGQARDSRVVESYISLSNQLYVKGLWYASQYIRDFLDAAHGPLPRSRAPIGVGTYVSRIFDTNLRYDPRSSGWVTKGLFLSIGSMPDPIGDIRAGMLLCFQKSGLHDALAVLRHRRDDYEQQAEVVRDHRNSVGIERLLPIRLRNGGDFENRLPRFWDRIGNDVMEPTVGIRNGGFGLDTDYVREWTAALRMQILSDYARNIVGRSAENIVTDSHGIAVSTDSYVSNTKRRWTPTRVGLPGWLKS